MAAAYTPAWKRQFSQRISEFCTTMAFWPRDVARRPARRAPLWRFGRETSVLFWKRKLISFSQRPDVSRPKRHSGARLAGRLATSRGQNAIVVHFSGQRSRRSRNFTSGAQWPQRARKSTRVGALAPSCASGSSSLHVSRGEPRAASRARARPATSSTCWPTTCAFDVNMLVGPMAHTGALPEGGRC